MMSKVHDVYDEWRDYQDYARANIVKVASKLMSDNKMTYDEAWTMLASDHNVYMALLDKVREQMLEYEKTNDEA